MDRLDRFSIWAIVFLIIGSTALISSHVGEAKPGKHGRGPALFTDAAERSRRMGTVPGVTEAEMESRVRAARNLLEVNMGKAEALVQELIVKYPYEGEPHMAMGDIFMRRQEPIKAIVEYKEAVELNPDYLDRKTPLFQGKKMKATVNEALAEIEQRIKEDPGNGDLKKHRKDIYYLQRRIAGSCG